MEFIYQKQSNLDKENNFTIEISEKDNVEKDILFLLILIILIILLILFFKPESEA